MSEDFLLQEWHDVGLKSDVPNASTKTNDSGLGLESGTSRKEDNLVQNKTTLVPTIRTLNRPKHRTHSGKGGLSLKSNGSLAINSAMTSSEAAKLLDISSDTSESDLNLEMPPKRKVRFKRKFRAPSRGSKTKANNSQDSSSCSSCYCSNSVALFGFLILGICSVAQIWFHYSLSSRFDVIQKQYNAISETETPKLDPTSRLDVAFRSCKKMKKRKELDALVQGQKLGKRVSNKKTQPRSESKVSAHQLLGNDTESSDLDDFTIINTQRSKGKKSGTSSGLCAASCLPLCLMILVTTLIAALGTILWLHLGLREDLDSIRAHLQKVEAQSKETPEALHDYHIQLKNLEFNATTFADELKKINSEIVIINEAVRLLKTTTASLKDSIAAAPEIKTIPKDFTAITESVVNLGSKITQLESTVKELKTTQTGLKDSAQTLQKGQDELKMNVTSLVLMKEELSSRKETVSPTETSFRDGIMAYVYKEIHHVQESFDELNATVTPKLNNLTEWGNHLGEMNDSLNWAMADLNSLHLFVYSNLSSSLRQVQSESGFQPDVSAQVEQTVIKMLSDALTDKVIDTTEVTNWKQLLRDASKMVVLYVDIVKKLSLNASSSSIPESLKANSFVDEALSDFERLNEMVAELSRNATQHSTFQSSVNQSLTLLRNQINSFSIQLAFLRSGQPTSSSQSSVTTTTKTQTTMTPINSNPPTSKPVLNDDPRKNLKMPINTDRPSRESVLKRALGGF